jgi:hypothetical protein
MHDAFDTKYDYIRDHDVGHYPKNHCALYPIVRGLEGLTRTFGIGATAIHTQYHLTVEHPHDDYDSIGLSFSSRCYICAYQRS